MFSSSITLYQHGNLGGQSLELSADDPDLTNNPGSTNNGNWNDQASSLRVTGPCQWILYEHTDYVGLLSVVGPGTRDYEAGSGTNGFGLSHDILSSLRCLPAYNTENMVLFQYDHYRGQDLVLSSSTSDLTNDGFNDDVSSLIITGGTWQLYSGANYQGSSVRLEQGHYPTASFIYPLADDDISSVRFVGKSLQ